MSAAQPGQQSLVQPSDRTGGASLWLQLRSLAVIFCELALIYLIVRAFKIESEAFRRLFLICSFGFVVHDLLRPRLRLPFFALLSVGCIVALLGVVHGGALIGLGLCLIGMAHLPVPIVARVLLLLAVGGVLAWLRTGPIELPFSSAIWPILGSMFMFRLIVYLYDLHNRAAPFSFWRALGYFFMAPNVCFPLFPVVDYKTFCRSHYDTQAARIYQSGVEWILKGVVQLLVYRLAYHYLTIDTAGVLTAVDALRFLVAGYALYLKISGSFHIVVGLLHLFGFNLPLTNQNYFLAAGFTDYWRRINVYWKEFLQKIFFNPLYFRFNRSMPPSLALTAATLVAFLVTWALHSYQWFWIRGSFPIRAQDIVFWTVMGLLVLANVHYEFRYGRKRGLRRSEKLGRDDFLRALRAVATFATISVLWCIWSTESLGEFRLVMSRLARFDLLAAAWLLAGIAILILLSLLLIPREQRQAPVRASLAQAAAAQAKSAQGPAFPAWRSVVQVGALCFAILVVRYSPRLMTVPTQLTNVIEKLHGTQLSRWDVEKLDRGYYEDLTEVVNFNTELSDLYAQRPVNWNRNPAQRPREGFPPLELIASKAIEFKGAPFTTNRWQLRDRDYQMTKPAGTVRLVVLGESNTLGQGVGDTETFENLVEDRLNAESNRATARYELLNFAMADCGPIAKLATLDRAFEFEPDAVLYMGVNELYWVVKELVLATQQQRAFPDMRLAEVVDRIGLTASTPRGEAVQLLESAREEVLAWIYGAIVQRCQDRNAQAFYAALPLPRDLPPDQARSLARELELAQQAGFTLIDIGDALEGVAYPQLWVREFDQHMNARGHALVADRLYPALRELLQGRSAPISGR